MKVLFPTLNNKKMHFYRKVLLVVLMIVVTVAFLTGMSNFEGSVGAPTLLEVKLSKNLRQSQYRHFPAQDLPVGTKSGYEVDNNGSLVAPSNNIRKDPKGEELRERVERVKGYCKKYHLGDYSWPNGTNDLGIKDPITPLYSYFFHDRDHRLAWCPVYKSGSTTWLYNMMVLKGYSSSYLADPPKQLSMLAEEVFQDAEPGKDFSEAYKLLVVRHPFERLMSAYRDKLSNSTTGLEHGTFHFYEKYGKKIVQKFRQDGRILQKEPTFEEFVRYLIKTDLVYYADDHWLPVYLSCTPCRVSYDFIAKVETYMEDQKYIIDQLQLSSILKPRWQHRSNRPKKSSPQELWALTSAEKYFSQLKKSQVLELYKKYYLDFHLFGYSYEDYLTFARKD